MDRDQLFIYTLKELRQRTADGASEYDLLMSAVPLRKLLADGRSLIQEVNRTRGERVRFLVADHQAYVDMILEDGAVFWAALDGISPRLGPTRKTREVDTKGWLETRVMRVGADDVSVRDVVSQVANIEGAVHIGEARNEKQRLLKAINEQMKFASADSLARTLVGISAVTLDGMVPLLKRILADRDLEVPDT